MRLLALDAATEACSVALLIDGALISRSLESGKSSAAKLVAMVNEVLAEGAVSLSGLDGIAAGIGPGSFTGVRITVAVAQGIAFGANLPVTPVTTLEALAMQLSLPEGVHALACLDARMNEIYWGGFAADLKEGVIETAGSRVGPPDSVVIEPDRRYWGIGRGFTAYPALSQLPGVSLSGELASALPNAREIARLGALRLSGGHALDPADVKPLYLRDKVAFTEAERAAR